MDSEYDILSSLFSTRPSRQGAFGAGTQPGASNPFGTGGDFQLAPLYSNPQHHQQRDNIGDILNRYQGQTSRPYQQDGAMFDGDYEANEESHVSYDENGMHVGVSMSRSHQTPFGTARTDVGMQMSFGRGGVMFRTRSSSSLGGGHGGILMLSRYGGGSSFHSSRGQSMFEPMGGMLSPFGGLFSPFGGRFPSLIGSYESDREFDFRRQSRNQETTYGSDGPIIEEVFDEEESSDPKHKSTSNSALAIGYKDDAIDPSLGLGLLPESETTYSGNCQSRDDHVEQVHSSVSSGILNDFAYTDSTHKASNPRTNEPNFGSRYKVENETHTLTRTEPRLTESQDHRKDFSTNNGIGKTCFNAFKESSASKKSSSNGLMYQKNEENAKKLKVNKNKQMSKSKLGLVNKNSSLRRRNDSSCSDVSEAGQTTDFEVVLPPKASEITKASGEHIEDTTNAVSDTEKTWNHLDWHTNDDVRAEDKIKDDFAVKGISEDASYRHVAHKETDENLKIDSETSCNDSLHNDNQPISLQNADDYSGTSSKDAENVTFKASSDTSDEETCFKTFAHENTNSREISDMALTDEINIIQPDDRCTPALVSDNALTDETKIILPDDRCTPTLVSDNVFTDETNIIIPEDRWSPTPVSDNELIDETKIIQLDDRYSPTLVSDNVLTDETKIILPYDRCTPTLVSDDVLTDETNSIIPEDRWSPTPVSDNELTDETKIIQLDDRYSPTLVSDNVFTDETNIILPEDRWSPRPVSDEGSLSDVVKKDDEEADHENPKEQKEVINSDNKENDAGSKSTSKSNDDFFSPEDSALDLAIPLTSEERNPQEKTGFVILLTISSDGFKKKSDRPITTFMTKNERKNEARNMFQIKHGQNEIAMKSDFLNTTDDTEFQQVNAKTKSNGEQAFVSKQQEQTLESDRFSRRQAIREETYSQDKEERGSPVLNQGDRVSESAKDIFNVQTNEHVEKQSSHPENVEHLSSTNQRQKILQHTNKRRQDMNNSTTDEDLTSLAPLADPEEYPHQHNGGRNVYIYSHTANKSEHSKHGGHGHCFCCEHIRRQLQCSHSSVQKHFTNCCHEYHFFCNDCDKEMTPEEMQKADVKRKREKAKINKNATPNNSSSSSPSRQGQDEPRGIQEARSGFITFGDLVESVGLTMKDVYPDGNCLFTAVCDQLRIRGDFSYTPRDLRYAAVEFLREHPNQEDGTPLLAFLTDDERSWDKYLKSMSRDGHWGDHFVIWALAHILDRRIVIYRGNKELQTTIVEPIGPMTEDAFKEMDNGPESTKEETENRADAKHDKDKPSQQELYLGHISESHYVSLRPNNWRENLFQALKAQPTSCLIGSNPESKPLDSNGDVSFQRGAFLFSPNGLNYFLNYLRRGNVIYKYEMLSNTSSKSSSHGTTHFVGDLVNGLEYMLLTTLKKKRVIPSNRETDIDCYFLSTPHDTTVVFDRRNGNVKDLVLHDDRLKVGQFKLTPIKPAIWKPNITFRDDVFLLKHIEYKTQDMAKGVILGFKCESWPEECMEWKTRHRPNAWPSLSTIEEIVKTGVRIVPEKQVQLKNIDDKNNEVLVDVKDEIGSRKHESTGSKSYVSAKEENELIWRYDFAISENILCKRGIGTETKQLHSLLGAVIRFAFGRKELMTKDHLKTLTFFTCEKFSSDDVNHYPGKCLLYALDLLQDFLQRKYFPHYFIRARNLIADMEYSDIEWHVERLQVLKTNVMAILYCVLDDCTLQNLSDVGKVFDDLVLGKDKKEDEERNLVRLCVTSVTNVVKSKKFIGAEGLINTWHRELVMTYDKETMPKFEFVNEILLDLTVQEEWLFAFYLDCREGSGYVQHITTGKPCVNFKSLFGDEVVAILTGETALKSTELCMSTSILGESMVNLASRLAEVIKYDICSTKAYQSAIFHFLKENTHDLLLSIEKDQRDQKDYLSQNKLSDLMYLFKDLYDSCQEEGATFLFRELMDVYEELCNFVATENDFVFLSKLWAYFGDNERAKEAHMKAVSVKGHMMSTAL